MVIILGLVPSQARIVNSTSEVAFQNWRDYADPPMAATNLLLQKPYPCEPKPMKIAQTNVQPFNLYIYIFPTVYVNAMQH